MGKKVVYGGNTELRDFFRAREKKSRKMLEEKLIIEAEKIFKDMTKQFMKDKKKGE